jgi:hypothetical protein
MHLLSTLGTPPCPNTVRPDALDQGASGGTARRLFEELMGEAQVGGRGEPSRAQWSAGRRYAPSYPQAWPRRASSGAHPRDHLPPEGEPTSHRPGDDAIEVHRISSSHVINCPDRTQGLSTRASQSTASSPHKSSLALTCAPRFAQEAKSGAVIRGDASASTSWRDEYFGP